MKKYGFDLKVTHGAAIFEIEKTIDDYHKEVETEGVEIIGTSEWITLTEDNAKRICAALTYFSETSTEEIEKLAQIELGKG